MTLKEKLKKKFVVTVELGGTQGMAIEKSLEDAEKLKRADAINIIDCAMGKLRINAFCLARLIQEKLEICCIPHLTRRDRSILALQADLLGASALGIRYILTTTGDPPNCGPYKDSKPVYNITTLELIKLISNFNKGLDYNENDLTGNTDFFISATATPQADNLDAEIDKVKSKIDAGANFLQTQPIYDIDKTKRFLEKAKPLGIPILLGIMPLKSSKMIDYLNKNVPGINVPEEIIRKFESCNSGIVVANELIDQIYDLSDGIHVMAMGDVTAVNEIIDHVEGLNVDTKK